MRGYIKLDRKLLNWGWFKNGDMLKLWVYLLLVAQHEDAYEDGVLIKRGQVRFGRKQASKDTGISEQSIRTCLNRLKSTKEITIKSTNKYSIITILKYDDYQGAKKKSTNKLTNKSTSNQPATNQQLTTYKNDKNDKNDKKYIDDVVSKIKIRWLEAGYKTSDVNTAEEILNGNVNEKSFKKVMNVLTNPEIRNPLGYITTLKMKGEL